MQPTPADAIRADLPLRRYAAISGELRRAGRDRASNILAREELSPEAWQTADRAWKEAIEQDLEGTQGLLLTFAEIFTEARGDAPPKAVAEETAPEPVPAAPVEVQVPTFLAPTPVPAGQQPGFPKVNRAPESLTGTIGVSDGPRAPELPFAAGPSAESRPAGQTPTLPKVARTPESVTGTVVGGERLRGPDLPFGGSPAPAHPSVHRAPESMTGTTAVSDAPRGPATPFQATDPEALGFDLLRYSELVAARGENGANLAEVFARFGIDAEAHARVEAYWARKFSKNGLLGLELTRLLGQAKMALAQRATPEPREPESGPPSLPAAPRAPESLTGTVGVCDPPSGPELPFSQRSAVLGAPLEVPDLTIEQYAVLRAHLAARGEDDAETLKRFGISSLAVKQALQERFAARFQKDPAAQAQFVDRLRQLVAELRRPRA